MKLDGEFTAFKLHKGIVTFVFSGTLLDSSHPESRVDDLGVDLPIEVEALKIASSNAVCMDHKNRRNYSFKDEPSDALECFERIRALVAAVPMTGIDFDGLETKSLDTDNLHFYDMEQVSK